MARKDSAPSSTPKKPGRIAQMRQVFTAAHAVDPMIGWWMALAALAVVVVLVVVGILVGHWRYFLVISIPLAALGLLNPVFAGAAMAMSSVSVVGNALLLRRWKPAESKA